MVAFKAKLDLFRVAVNGQNIFLDDSVNDLLPPSVFNEGGFGFGPYVAGGTYAGTGSDAITSQTATAIPAVNAAPAFNVKLDLFQVATNGQAFFRDTFSNNLPPPSLTDDLGIILNPYFTLPGSTYTETGGRVIMDSASSALRPALPNGDIPHSFQAILPTNVTPGGTTGLRPDRNFQALAKYDLVNLTENQTEYGIRFMDNNTVDGVPVGGDDVIAVSVRRGGDGITRVQLSERDFIAGTNEILGSVVLNPPVGANQIVLRLHYDKVTQKVTASFSYVKAGVEGAAINVPGFGKIFGMDTTTTADDEDFTRAAFYTTGIEDLGAKFLDGDEKANTLTGTSAADHLVGYGANDTLNGAGGNDILSGGTGADTMRGSTGNDTYFVDNSGDKVEETGSGSTGGKDTVLSSISYALPVNVENLILTGTANIKGTGNTLANTITGNSGNNILDGKAGADQMGGGAGDDTYIVDNTGDKAIEVANEGTDLVQSSVTFTLGVNVENLVLTGSAAINGTGNALGNTITGNTGNNVLKGLGGNDTYIVNNGGDTVIEASNAGTDTVRSAVTFGLSANVEHLILTGSGNINGNGNAGANSITGNAKDNVIDGGLGKDALTGLAGNDIFLFDTALNASTNVDTITDFKALNDTIQLDNTVFTALTVEGTLAASRFVIGTAAADADDHIIYNDATGALFYDADGSGAGAAIRFAILSTKPALTNADFDIS